MKVIVSILLIAVIVVIVILLSLVSYLLWGEVCDTYQENKKRAIATKRLQDEMKRICDEQTERENNEIN